LVAADTAYRIIGLIQSRRTLSCTTLFPSSGDRGGGGSRNGRFGGTIQPVYRPASQRASREAEEPDLIDADAFHQLDLFELAPEHFRIPRMFARGGGRPDGKLPPFILPGFEQQRAAAMATAS
jgi:hypothetical protein